jgi:uncharacterized Zn-binding protein involved in type VI secretion
MVTGLVPHVGGPILPPGAPTVLIGGLPAARVGDKCVCVGPIDVIAKGSSGVFIAGPMAARMGDMTAHGGVIVMGFPTVMIGETGGGGGPTGTGVGTGEAGGEAKLEDVPPGDLKEPDMQAAVLKQAAADGTPFCEECAKAAAAA